MYYNIVIDNHSRYTDDFFTYESDEVLEPGAVVKVPFGMGNHTRRGIVFETDVTPDKNIKKFKRIETDMESGVSMNEEMITACRWMRQRYGIKYIDAVRCFLPVGKPASPGKEKEPYADIAAEHSSEEVLTGEQQAAADTIEKSVRAHEHKIFLLYGVTGSGKTEVYMQAIEAVLSEGRTAIMLVPEIALTEQIVERFVGRFGKEEIAVLHSRLTKRERFDEWSRLRNGKAHIAIGARIGVFAPLENIGVIIMDEEHEATYKSDQTPRYDTVDIAVKRLMYSDGILILGSATPSVVSYQRACEGLYTLIEMKQRFNRTPLPETVLVDMRAELKSGNRGIFSSLLYSEIRRTVEDGKQVILFQNRRGYYTFISCRECGEALKCPDCDISLVYHRNEEAAVCHYCGRRYRIPEKCPACGSDRIGFFGIGTEQVEDACARFFPDYRTERLDLDTAKSTSEIRRIIHAFSKGKTNILIGTQLVAKGLDFRNVGLVGIVTADVSLNIPDYRSSERTFQLITQVSGRAGRGSERGKVIVQTFSPDEPVLKAAAAADYKSFFEREIRIREFMEYPPFSDLIAAYFTSSQEDEAVKTAMECRDYLIRIGLPNAEKIFDPEATASYKGKDRFRYHFLVKCPRGFRNKYIFYLRKFGDSLKKRKTDCTLIIDINPYNSY